MWHFGGPAGADAERNYVFGRTLSTASVHDGLCYISELDGFLHCLDARTGKKYWEHDMQADTWSSVYTVDGKIHIGNENGDLLIFEHSKKKKLINTVLP